MSKNIEVATQGAVESRYDALGVNPVPNESRTSGQLDQFFIWAGANVAPINWVLGAIGIQLGLSLVETLAVIIVGNLLGCALFGAISIMGHRTGVPQMVLSRLAFGRRGAYIPTFMQVLMPMGWVAMNTWIVLDLAIAALERMGVDGGIELKYLIAIIIMCLQVAIAAWGFNAIKYFERYTMPFILLIMVVMTVLAFDHVDVQWQQSSKEGMSKFSAMSSLMTAIGIGWGISWLVYASDYTRYTKATLSDRQVFSSSFLGMFVPTVWLAFLGAAIASAGSGSDPSQLIIAVFGAMALPVLLVLLHGPIATNIVVIYSAGLATLSLDMRVPRWLVSAISGVVALFILYLFLQSSDFVHAFENVMIFFVVWISPWAAITLVDFFLLRRGRIDINELYRHHADSICGDINWRGIFSLVLGVISAWLFQVGSIESMQGPIAMALGGVDLSWLAGFVVAGSSYYFLHRSRRANIHSVAMVSE
ncbi:purine-cytosine permease family protein [Marinobacterium rhizophilum]|uniref:Cytosine permease n=1 Tax=Marinobacterium rhizophilum TaxID=420402 RepID=A0ABY5HLW0_9GAMM|nr:cytosine permease [Marinobacterium rhizophilum]UTW13363.1 cytosine permease [Marinobacterium rhizophilum]